ncbi:MAG: RNA polymerase sigma factor [Flavobacteriaceae bacterium]|nr:RNA polymerase sigma factor [Flavobacteriaceae bacterium]
MTESEFLQHIIPFKNKAYRLAKRLLVSSDEAEDAIQEMYYKLWKNKDKIISYKNTESVAMTITKNYCLDRLKSKQAGNLTLIHNDFEENETSLEKKVEEKDSVSNIHKWIAELPEQQKMVMQLRDIEQYEFSEIAEILQLSEGTIRVALSRARKTIKNKLITAHQYGVATN